MTKTERAIIFGAGAFAEVAAKYLEQDSHYLVAAFTHTGEAGTFAGRPVVPFNDVERAYPPRAHDMFVAVGYSKLNRIREQFCAAARAKGYALLSYVSSRASHFDDAKIGDNVFIFEDNTIQPFVTIGDGVILWSGNHVGHHSHIDAYCFVSSHVVISGNCAIGERSFLGVNATIADGVSIGAANLIGPGTLIEKNTGPDEAYFAPRTPKFDRPASRFFK